MKHRIFSTILLWSSVIVILYFAGAIGAVLLLAGLSLFAQAELYRLLQLMGYAPLKRLGLTLGTLLILGAWWLPAIAGYPNSGAAADILAIALIVLIFQFLSNPDLTQHRASFLPTLLGLLLIPFLLSFYVRLAAHFDHQGLDAAALLCPLWTIAVAKFTDVGGLLVGMRFGKNRLAPMISPGKTWEGVVGGLIFSMLIGAALLLVFRNSFPPQFTLLKAILFAIPIAFIAVISDLMESVFKRQADVKDSGSFIPGIGGAFDLVDSLLLSAPVGYLLFQYFVF